MATRYVETCSEFGGQVEVMPKTLTRLVAQGEISRWWRGTWQRVAQG